MPPKTIDQWIDDSIETDLDHWVESKWREAEQTWLSWEKSDNDENI